MIFSLGLLSRAFLSAAALKADSTGWRRQVQAAVWRQSVFFRSVLLVCASVWVESTDPWIRTVDLAIRLLTTLPADVRAVRKLLSLSPSALAATAMAEPIATRTHLHHVCFTGDARLDGVDGRNAGAI